MTDTPKKRGRPPKKKAYVRKKKPKKTTMNGIPLVNNDPKIIDDFKVVDNDPEAFSIALGKYIRVRAVADKIGAPRISASRLSAIILDFMNQLGNVKNDYTRDMLISDLISLVKSGKANAAPMLSDLMGFQSANESFELNIVNFENIDIKNQTDMKPINLSTGKRD